MDGLKRECKFVLFARLVYAEEDLELTGEVQVLKMVPRSLLLHRCFKLEFVPFIDYFLEKFLICLF